MLTGFRVGPGGAQALFGVEPDLTVLAKAVGAGFPVAVVGGTREVMSMIAEGRYSHSGTYNANVVQCAAVSATMDLLDDRGLVRPPARARRPARGRPARSLRAEPASRRASRGWARSSSSGSPTTRSATGVTPNATPTKRCFTRWYQEMLLRGVLFHPSQYENLFVSMVHTDEDIDRTLEAASGAIATIAAERRGG